MKLYDQAPAGATSRARLLRRRATDAERRLWRALREALPHARFRRQTPVGPYIADFLSFAARLIVEVDGGQHAPEHDARRTAFLEAQSYRVVRFWNNDVLENIEGVLQTIAAQIPSPMGEGGAQPQAGRVRFSPDANKNRSLPTALRRAPSLSQTGEGVVTS